MTEIVTFLLGVFAGFLVGQVYQITRRSRQVDVEVVDEDERPG